MPIATLSEPTNSKLGPGIYSWSLPAGAAHSCPGETSLCRAVCYAKRGHFHHGSVFACHDRNLAFSKTPDFVPWMQQTIRNNLVSVLRVHVGGDFYSVEYVRKWAQIANTSRRTTLFGYTRSWRQPELLPELIRLSLYRNVQLWWSMDRETGPAPIVRGIKRAYLAIDDADANTAPDDCDLVFRDNPKTPMKKANGVQVCPPENGVPTDPKITCARCGICWRSESRPRWEAGLLTVPTTEIVAPENQGVVHVGSVTQA